MTVFQDKCASLTAMHIAVTFLNSLIKELCNITKHSLITFPISKERSNFQDFCDFIQGNAATSAMLTTWKILVYAIKSYVPNPHIYYCYKNIQLHSFMYDHNVWLNITFLASHWLCMLHTFVINNDKKAIFIK